MECVSAVVEVLQNQIWNAKVLILERQDKNVYVLALASPDQVTGAGDFFLWSIHILFEWVLRGCVGANS